MKQGFFITGTDTGVGKTFVSIALLRSLLKQGYSVLGMKPVASGCEAGDSGLCNVDALHLREQASFEIPYRQVNPYAFEPAIAPHLAARIGGVTIEVSVIRQTFETIRDQAQYLVVEGVGGWLVPINERQTMADVAQALGLPVILVVAIRLGCLNHALLTLEAIERSGLPLAGWVANRMDPQCEYQDENVRSLVARIPAPMLADIAYQENGLSGATDIRFSSVGDSL